MGDQGYAGSLTGPRSLTLRHLHDGGGASQEMRRQFSLSALFRWLHCFPAQTGCWSNSITRCSLMSGRWPPLQSLWTTITCLTPQKLPKIERQYWASTVDGCCHGNYYKVRGATGKHSLIDWLTQAPTFCSWVWSLIGRYVSYISSNNHWRLVLEESNFPKTFMFKSWFNKLYQSCRANLNSSIEQQNADLV